MSSNYSNLNTSKFSTPDNTTGWIRMSKHGKFVRFSAALEIATNFGQWTDYKICDIAYTAYNTQYGIAVSDTGKTIPLKISNGEKGIYAMSRGDTAIKTGEWIWCDFMILCTS